MQTMNNESFNRVEFEAFKNMAGENSITPILFRPNSINLKTNREKELFIKNNIKSIERIEKK